MNRLSNEKYLENFNNVINLCSGTGYDKETLVYIDLEIAKYVVKLTAVRNEYLYIHLLKGGKIDGNNNSNKNSWNYTNCCGYFNRSNK